MLWVARLRTVQAHARCPLWTTTGRAVTSSSEGRKRQEVRPQEVRQQRVVFYAWFKCSD